MSRFWAVVSLDVRVQSRSRLYAVGILAAVALGFSTRVLVPPEHLGRALPIIYLLGVGGTTYMFAASMVLSDKSSRTLDALRVSALRASEYLGSKAVTLSGFAVLESMTIYVVAGAPGLVEAGPLFCGAGLLGLSLALIGMGQVAPHDQVTSFLMPGAVFVTLVLQLPSAYALGLGPTWLWFLVPSHGPFLIMLSGAEELGVLRWCYALLMTAGFVALSFGYAMHRFRSHIGLREA